MVDMDSSDTGIPELFYGEPGRPGPAGHTVTIPELAKIIGLHPSTVRDWVNDGLLPAFRPGGPNGTWRITTTKAIAFLEAQTNVPDNRTDSDAEA